MELLSVAQKYQIETALANIRGTIARQSSLPTGIESAIRIYFLAKKYGLRPEALQSARTILVYPLSIENWVKKVDIMPGASLYELWKYNDRVRAILVSDLVEFRASGARGTITGLKCKRLSSSRIPMWFDEYIESIGGSPNLFNSAELNTAMARHFRDTGICSCASIPSQTMRNFWEALASVVHGSFEKVSMVDATTELLSMLNILQAESALSLVPDQEDPQAQTNTTTSPPEAFDLPDANLIIRSSDLVDFRVHMSVLALTSPIFKDLLSLPQPSDSESVDGLPVVQLSEDSELLNSLVSMLYPVPTVMPNSYHKVWYLLATLSGMITNFYCKVLYLLAACQKYEMASVQSYIRAKVKCKEFPAPKGAEAFAAYGIASAKGLIPEMKDAVRLTLKLPMTFERLGEGLRFFEGSALLDLANSRKRAP
jgi:hypothetical protein